MDPASSDALLARSTLARLLPDDTGPVLDWLLEQGQILTAQPGEPLLAASEPPRLGLLLRGRLEAHSRTIRPGMVFAEEHFLGRERHESVFTCAQAATYYCLSLEAFDRGFLASPTAFLALLRQLSHHHQERRRAVWTLGEGTQPLIPFLQAENGVLVVQARLPEGESSSWLAALEQDHDKIFLIGDETAQGWERFCQDHSDGTLTLRPVGAHAAPRIEVKGKTPYPALPGRLDQGNSLHLARTARLLAGSARGLVLSGGGARGFAHIGALKALVERGWVPDSLGGTSMGALVAALWAVHQDVEVLLDLARLMGKNSRVLDWIPGVTSLTRGRKVAGLMDDLFGSRRIDDLELPFFCVATDLTRAREVVFSSGPLGTAVRASLAIPGVFYPVVRHGSILVDGGLMNNLPLDVLARRLNGGSLLACDVTAGDWLAPTGWIGAKRASRGAWKQVFDQFRPSSRRKVPALADLLLQSLEVNSRRHYRETAPAAHHLLALNVTGFDPLDFGRWKLLVEEGYRQTCHYIDSMLY